MKNLRKPLALLLILVIATSLLGCTTNQAQDPLPLDVLSSDSKAADDTALDATERNATASLRARYVEEFIRFIEGESVKTKDVINLLDINSREVIAVCYTLSTGGYAIIDIHTNIIYEYSLDAPSPYEGQTTPCYYDGPNNYFVESSRGIYTHTKNNLICVSATDVSTSKFSDYRESIKNISPLSEKIADLETARTNPSRAAIQGSLTSTLSTLWINNMCGPTSIHCMLKYQGKLRNPPATGTGEITEISKYIPSALNLADFVSGTQAYLNANKISGTVRSSSTYSWSLVASRINANKPITLGTSGTNGSDGHLQVIHKYYSDIIPPSNEQIYILYVNNSHGSNNVALAYYNTTGVPSNFVDHFYVD